MTSDSLTLVPITHGMMGYKTPNIDRIAREGAMFTIGMVSKAAPQAEPPSSLDSQPFARA